MADKYIEEEKYNKIWIANVLLPQILCFCMTAIPCALAAYFGSSYIQGILAMLSGKVLTVFQIIGGLMPALGIAITLQYIFKGESKVFLFIGFLLAVYSKVTIINIRYHCTISSSCICAGNFSSTASDSRRRL